MRNRTWCFTINNDIASDMDFLDHSFKYLLFGFEKGKEGTPHIQGFFVLHEGKTVKSLKKIFPRAHLEVTKGTFEQNYKYCTKEGEFWEFGEKPQQGHRTDLDSLVSMISDGSTREEIKARYPKMYFMYKKKIEDEVPKTVTVHDKKLMVIPEEGKYDYPGAFIDFDIQTYENEHTMVVPAYERSGFNIIDWIKGFPPRIRRGYEIIHVDPTHVYITYRDAKEYNYIIKTYGDYIDDVTLKK